MLTSMCMSEFIKRTAVGELCLNFNPGRVWELPVGRPTRADCQDYRPHRELMETDVQLNPPSGAQECLLLASYLEGLLPTRKIIVLKIRNTV